MRKLSGRPFGGLVTPKGVDPEDYMEMDTRASTIERRVYNPPDEAVESGGDVVIRVLSQQVYRAQASDELQSLLGDIHDEQNWTRSIGRRAMPRAVYDRSLTVNKTSL